MLSLLLFLVTFHYHVKVPWFWLLLTPPPSGQMLLLLLSLMLLLLPVLEFVSECRCCCRRVKCCWIFFTLRWKRARHLLIKSSTSSSSNSERSSSSSVNVIRGKGSKREREKIHRTHSRGIEKTFRSSNTKIIPEGKKKKNAMNSFQQSMRMGHCFQFDKCWTKMKMMR